MGTTLYGYTTDEREYSVSVPEIMTGDTEVRIYLSAHGGGTVGESYAGNGWDYLVTDDGVTVIEGSDLRSPEGRPADHAEMAQSLASFLSAAGEHFAYRHSQCGSSSCDYWDDYSDDEADWLAANYERLGLFSPE